MWRRFKKKRAPAAAEEKALELQRQCNALLPKADPFTDAIVAGFRLKDRVYEKLRSRFVTEYIQKKKEKMEKAKSFRVA